MANQPSYTLVVHPTERGSSWMEDSSSVQQEHNDLIYRARLPSELKNTAKQKNLIKSKGHHQLEWKLQTVFY